MSCEVQIAKTGTFGASHLGAYGQLNLYVFCIYNEVFGQHKGIDLFGQGFLAADRSGTLLGVACYMA